MNPAPHHRTAAPIRIVALGVAWIALGAAAVPAHAVTIDFESPPLGGLARMVVDPYIVPGVTFVAAPGGEVGIVRNDATSACVDPPDADQKLGTAPAGSGAIGLSTYTIRANFSPYLAGAVQVAAEFQALAGSTLSVLLYNNYGYLVASKTETALPGDGTCGYPGNPRARKTVTAIGNGTVAYALFDVEPNSNVFVIDDVFYSSGRIIAIREGSGGGNEPMIALGIPSGSGPFLSITPNPARAGDGRIAFRVPAQGEVDLAIFDAEGRRIRSLLAGAAASAGHVVWDGLDDAGRPATAGIYFVRLESGATRETGRLTLIR
jgi:catechol 2,3-dioxygenase-like lactoylglutathione lyase family enzyme